MTQQHDIERALRRVSIFGAAGAIVIAILGLMGYIPGLGLLGRVHETYTPMAASTAGCFMLLGGVLLALTLRSLSKANLIFLGTLAALVYLFAVLEMAGHVLGRDLNFERLLVPVAEYLHVVPIVAMPWATGVTFTIAGLATLALVLRRSRNHARNRDWGTRLGHLAGGLGTLILGIDLLVWLVYVDGSTLLYGDGTTFPMAATTALAFLTLGTAVVGIAGENAFPIRLMIGFYHVEGAMGARKTFAILAFIMIGVRAMVMAIMTLMLFRYDLQKQREMLQLSTQSQARLIEAVARSNVHTAYMLQDDAPDYDAIAATVKQVIDAHKTYEGFGRTGEFALARRDGDSIDFVLRHQLDTNASRLSIPFESELAEPMRRALSKQSGTVIGLDYEGTRVLAAYEPVAVLDMGIVAKMDLDEIRAPFVRAGLAAATMALIVVLAGTMLFFRVGNPIVAELEVQARELMSEVVHRRESENMLRAFMESATEGFIVYDSDMKLSMINATALKIFPPGCTRDSLRGKHILEIAPGLKESGRYDAYVQVIQTGTPIHFDDVIPEPHANNRRLSLSVFETGGGLGIVFTDITDRKLAEGKLLASEQRFRTLFEQSDGYNMILDPNTPSGIPVIVDANQAACDVHGYTRDEFIGRPIDSIDDAEGKRLCAERTQWIMSGKPLRSENTHVRRDGTTFDVSVHATRIDIEGQPPLIFSTEFDITDRKQIDRELERHREHSEELVQERTAELDHRVAEAEKLNSAMVNVMEDLQAANRKLAAATRELSASNKELDAFTYTVSHDLRAPLRHIHGFVGLLVDHTKDTLDPISLRFVETIAKSSDRMGQLIDDLLAFSRTSRSEAHLRSVDSNKVVRDARQELVIQTENRCIQWDIADLPNVHADAALLRQVWDNLIGNAIKYTSTRQDAHIEIGVTREGADPDSGEIVFFVRDNGVGFDPDYKHKLFGVFQRLHGKGQFEGTGIGLATVRRIVHHHGGRVWGEGAVDQGAAFYFTLKAAGEEE